MSTFGIGNVSGLYDIRLSKIADINTSLWPLLSVDGLELLGAVTSSLWQNPTHILGSAVMTEKSVRVNGDLFWDVRVSFGIPDNSDVSLAIGQDVRKRYVADVTDNNGNRRLVGTPEDPLTIDVDGQSGDAPPALNGQMVVLTARLRNRPPFYAP